MAAIMKEQEVIDGIYVHSFNVFHLILQVAMIQCFGMSKRFLAWLNQNNHFEYSSIYSSLWSRDMTRQGRLLFVPALSRFVQQILDVVTKHVKLYHKQARQAIRTSEAHNQQNIEQIADKVLHVLERYGQHSDQGKGVASAWLGKRMFRPMIVEQISQRQAIKMILPAFPWKSINTTSKVLGRLPDLGEILALAKLHQICVDIKQHYEPGAKIVIASDGLVFDDVVGIESSDTWAYSEALIQIINEQGFNTLMLKRPMEILGLTGSDTLTKDKYLQLCHQTRKVLIHRYGRTEQEIQDLIKSDDDSRLTYCGFVRFLETDLKYSQVAKKAQSGHQYRKEVKRIAKQMMVRAESFTKLLKSHCPDHVRLSIHPSSGAVKLSLPLIDQKEMAFPRTPWHSCIALALDGSLRTCHSGDVNATHRLIKIDGRPVYFREKSALWDWEEDLVDFEPSYGGNLMIRPRAGQESKLKLTKTQMERIKQLTRVYRGRIVLEGF